MPQITPPPRLCPVSHQHLPTEAHEEQVQVHRRGAANEEGEKQSHTSWCFLKIFTSDKVREYFDLQAFSTQKSLPGRPDLDQVKVSGSGGKKKNKNHYYIWKYLKEMCDSGVFPLLPGVSWWLRLPHLLYSGTKVINRRFTRRWANNHAYKLKKRKKKKKKGCKVAVTWLHPGLCMSGTEMFNLSPHLKANPSTSLQPHHNARLKLAPHLGREKKLHTHTHTHTSKQLMLCHCSVNDVKNWQ